MLERVCAIPFSTDGSHLKVAITDPQDVRGLDELRLATRQSVEFFVAAKNDVLTEIRRLSRAAEAMNASFIGDMAGFDEDEDDLEADDGISDAPLVRLVNSLIFAAAEDGASDIHVEPQEEELIVRYRIDGVLHVAQRIPKRLAAGVTTRLKVLSKLDIAERRKPQDGRITLSAAAAGRLLDIRVATLPTVEGEAVTMRLLDKSREVPTLAALGLSEPMQEQMGHILARPTGALLVTGPTGSGKSTTLYAALAEISRPEINVITVEDPVEYRLAGISQVQINPRAGLTFANALRSILRSDPDVVMVGEIRDGETARISIEAAMTGHFVLSTLHTNDAPAALSRLTEMGVEPFVTGAAVSAVLAQRLARKLCTHCAEAYQPTRDELLALHVSEELAAALRRRGLPPEEGLRPLRPDRLPRPRRRLPAPRDELAPRAARVREGVARADSARRRSPKACARCGRTGSARSRSASRRPKSSPASARSSAPADPGRLDRPESPVRVLWFAESRVDIRGMQAAVALDASLDSSWSVTREGSVVAAVDVRQEGGDVVVVAGPVEGGEPEAVPLPDPSGCGLVPD